MVSANHWLRSIETYTFLWELPLVSANHALSNSSQGPVSRKSRKLFGPEKPFVKFRPAYSVKLVFSYVVKGIKIKTTAKFCASRRPRFEDEKRIMSPEMLPKSFGTFEKRAPGLGIIRCMPFLISVAKCPLTLSVSLAMRNTDNKGHEVSA